MLTKVLSLSGPQSQDKIALSNHLLGPFPALRLPDLILLGRKAFRSLVKETCLRIPSPTRSLALCPWTRRPTSLSLCFLTGKWTRATHPTRACVNRVPVGRDGGDQRRVSVGQRKKDVDQVTSSLHSLYSSITGLLLFPKRAQLLPISVSYS